jgi:hypothetical protein
METITQSNNQKKIESGVSFDKESRESYFEMLEQAYINLLLVEPELVDLEALLQE